MNKHASLRQLEIMIEYMEHHKRFALGYVRSKEGLAISNKLWKELTHLLNSESGAAFRSPKGWNKFYNDYKCRIKTKARKYMEHMNGTGGGPANAAAPLTPLEERLFAIVRRDSSDPLPIRRKPLDIEQPTKLRATNQRTVHRIEKSKAQSNIDELVQIQLTKMQVSRDMVKAQIARNKIEEKKVHAIKEYNNIPFGKLAEAASAIAEWIKNK